MQSVRYLVRWVSVVSLLSRCLIQLLLIMTGIIMVFLIESSTRLARIYWDKANEEEDMDIDGDK